MAAKARFFRHFYCISLVGSQHAYSPINAKSEPGNVLFDEWIKCSVATWNEPAGIAPIRKIESCEFSNAEEGKGRVCLSTDGLSVCRSFHNALVLRPTFVVLLSSTI